MPGIAGLTRVRNESEIIKDTLDHFARFCNAGIYVFDDASTDETLEICLRHPAVRQVIQGSYWEPDPDKRLALEGVHRRRLLDEARRDNPEWFLYFDADERLDFNPKAFPWEEYDAIRMRLFDCYITPEDQNKHWKQRRWFGPEYREIIFFFRNHPLLQYRDREVTVPEGFRIANAGYVKHYGKAISIQQWEETCDYYIHHHPEPYRSKWLARKGKAIHTLSDFGMPLIQWHEKAKKGVPVEAVLRAIANMMPSL